MINPLRLDIMHCVLKSDAPSHIDTNF